MHIHAQTVAERDRQVVLVFRGSDEHVAITTSLTFSITCSCGSGHSMETREIGIGRNVDREPTHPCGPGRTLERESTWFCGPGRTLERENTRFRGSGRMANFKAGDSVAICAADK